MEDRQILGSAEIATNFSKLSCPAASQESPGMFHTSVFHSDRYLQEVFLVIEDMECRGLDIIYYIKFSWILDELHHHHHHHHGDCYGIAHCNGRQIFPGHAQLFATNFYMLSCSAADQESGMISLYSILWLIPARLAHYWRHGMWRTGHHGDCGLHLIIIIDLRCMICSEEFVLCNDCILVRVILRSKTLAMYLCVSRSKVYSPWSFSHSKKICEPATLRSGCWRISKVLPLHLVRYWFRAR